MSNTVLIVEGDETLAGSLRDHLVRGHWDVSIASSPEDAMAQMENLRPDVVITDQRLALRSGPDLILHALTLDPETKVIVMTSDGSVAAAVEAMKAGAFDYLTKPVSPIELKLVMDKAVGQVRLEKTLSVLQRKEGRGSGLDSIIGESPAMRAMKDKVRRLLEAESHYGDELPPILIMGETGTGKELLARAIHFEGTRRSAPFVEINCTSLPPNLLEAELFGHERGAFSDTMDRKIGLIEAADGGTLFLEQIGEIDLSIQAKLLKLLEDKSVRRIGSVRERQVNVRILAASNQDLEPLVQQNLFRSDLFVRLNPIGLSLPPLRDCGQDILRIAEHYLRIFAKRYGRREMRFSPDAQVLLLGYAWPGNVREMRIVVEQSVLLAQGGEISAAQLTLRPHEAQTFERVPAQGAMRSAGGMVASPAEQFADTERDLVIRTLEKTDWNVSKSAKLLGLSRDMLRYRIEKYGLSRREE